MSKNYQMGQMNGQKYWRNWEEQIWSKSKQQRRFSFYTGLSSFSLSCGVTEMNDLGSFRNNFLLIWTKFWTRELYTQSPTVRLHPGPHKSEFIEGTRKILKFTMGNLPKTGWFPPVPPCFPLIPWIRFKDKVSANSIFTAKWQRRNLLGILSFLSSVIQAT